jgi:dephospho-CoA kinase
MIVIGITGTLGAGKGTIVEFLKTKRGFAHFSVRNYILQEIRKLGLPENRDSMVIVANDLREKNSPSFITDQLYKQAMVSGRNAVIESIRTPGEVESLRKKSRFFLFAVDAHPQTRFKRIQQRNSETDQIDFETFLANENREMNSDDPHKQNLQKCIELADFKFVNNGTVEELIDEVKKVLKRIEFGNNTIKSK